VIETEKGKRGGGAGLRIRVDMEGGL